MHRWICLFAGAIMLVTCGSALAQTDLLESHPDLEPLVDFLGESGLSVMDLVGYKAVKEAMKGLNFSKGDPDILALTNAGYVANVGNYSTERALNGLMMTGGFSSGKGNLVNVHSAYNKPLWFAFFDKETGDCIYLEVNGSYLEEWLEKESEGVANLSAFLEVDPDILFSKISKENIDPDELITREGAEAWHHNFEEKTFGGNEFSIITISSVWSKGMSNELLRSAELHNHICPGLTSGYLIAEYLKKHYPLKDDEKWVVWAVPPWCKDDALQQILDATVGKRCMAVMYIPKNISNKLPASYKDIAGIYVKLDKDGNARAIVLGFNWSKVCSDCNISRKDFRDFKSYKWWWARLRADLILMEHEPEDYISVLMEKDLGNQGSVKMLNAKWMAVGANPLVELGILEETETPAKKTPSTISIAVIAIILTAILLYIARRKR